MNSLWLCQKKPDKVKEWTCTEASCGRTTEEEPKFHAYFRHDLKHEAYRCYWCPHEDVIGRAFIEHIKTRHGFNLASDKFLIYFETRRVVPFVQLFYCTFCYMRTSDNNTMRAHKRVCRSAPLPRSGPTYTINDVNLDSFLADHTRELAWVKGFASKDKPRAILAAPQQPVEDDVIKAGDDEDLCDEDVIVENEQDEEELEGATAYPALEEEKPLLRPAPGLPRQSFEFRLPPRGRGRARGTGRITLTAEEITLRRIRLETSGETTTTTTVEDPVTTTTTVTEDPVTPTETNNDVTVATVEEVNNNSEDVARATEPRRPRFYTTHDEIDAQCKMTGRMVIAMGDLIPTKKSTPLTIQRVYLDDLPLPGRYTIFCGDTACAQATASAFPQNIHLMRWGYQPHDSTDDYVAHLWTTETIPPVMAV